MRYLVDSSALIALAEPKDDHHASATRFVGRLEPTESLLLSDYVFDETVTWLRRRGGHRVACEFGDLLRSSSFAKILRLEAVDAEEAWSIFRRYKDKELSFTDCTNVALARRLAIAAIFAFDEDFRHVGLKVVP